MRVALQLTALQNNSLGVIALNQCLDQARKPRDWQVGFRPWALGPRHIGGLAVHANSSWYPWEKATQNTCGGPGWPPPVCACLDSGSSPERTLNLIWEDEGSLLVQTVLKFPYMT